MKKWENYLFSIVFLAALFVFAILSAVRTVPVLSETVSAYFKTEPEDGVSDAVKNTLLQVDDDISKNVYNRYGFIEAYGEINRLLGKKEINGFSYALDKNGAYNSVNFWNEVDDIDIRRLTQQMVNLKDKTEENGGKFMFLAFPNKFDPAWNEGYEGIPYNDHNCKTDEMLLWCRRYGIDNIDFRETLKNSGLSFNEMFYKTDHHWTGYAAFLAYVEMVDYMNEKFDAGLDPDHFYRDINNYNVEWVDDCLLGASGRSVGMAFGNTGLEDFQILYPKYSNNIEWDNYKVVAKGDYQDTLIHSKELEFSNPYDSDAYGYYVGGIYRRERIDNKDNPDGPKVLMIRDSFASPMLVEMTPLFSTIECVWGKYAADGYIESLVESGEYDYVIVAYYPEDIQENFFKFYKDVYKTD